MKILSIETATEACSAAIYNDGQLIEKYEVCPKKHTQKILDMVDGVLNEAKLSLDEVDAIAYGQGPGSFTGVRLCVSVAQGLGFGSDKPLIPVSSLAALGLKALKQSSGVDTVLTALDARMNELYVASFTVKQASLVPLKAEELIAIDGLAAWAKGMDAFIACGHGVQSVLRDAGLDCAAQFPDLLPSAGQIATLAAQKYKDGEIFEVGACSATYLRNKVVHNRL